ncbi:MAG TPA: Dabb family protein [Cytophagales bacterium]|nr:Dabb family protein [Cytophagales bacterium]
MRTKYPLIFLAIAILIPVAILLTGFTNKNPLKKNESKMVRHIVIFKYKSSATEAQIKQVTEAFAALKNKIPGIVSFESGVNSSTENLNKGFTHIYQLTFKNEKARDQYLPHPDHEKFGDLLGKLGITEEVFVVDYTPSEI